MGAATVENNMKLPQTPDWPYDPAIPLLGIHPDKAIIKEETRTPMFIAVLLIIAKTWKQPKCSLTDDWIKMWYMYITEYYLTIRMHEIMPSAITWRDLEIIILIEVKSERERQILYITDMWNLKYDTTELIYKTETDSDIIKNIFGCQGGGWLESNGLGVWD